MKKQLVVKLPRAMWRLFHVLLEREHITMQEWIDKAVGDAIAAHGLTRGHDERAREFVSSVTRAVDAVVVQTEQEVPASMTRKLRSTAAGQVIARIDSGRLGRFQNILNDRGLSTTSWLRHKIAQAVSQQRVRAADVLSPTTLRVVGHVLPLEKEARETMAYVLLDWPDAVVAEASADPEYGLRDALGEGDVATASEILAVAAKAVDAKAERAALAAKRRARRSG